MRLNIRLIGLLHGILVIGLIGHFVFRVAATPGWGPTTEQQQGQ